MAGRCLPGQRDGGLAEQGRRSSDAFVVTTLLRQIGEQVTEPVMAEPQPAVLLGNPSKTCATAIQTSSESDKRGGRLTRRRRATTM
jgi:hypothetical protein